MSRQKRYELHRDTANLQLHPDTFCTFSVGMSQQSVTMHVPVQSIKSTKNILYHLLRGVCGMFPLICMVRDSFVAKHLAKCSQMYLSSSSSTILSGL